MPGPNCDLDKQLRKLLTEPSDEEAITPVREPSDASTPTTCIATTLSGASPDGEGMSDAWDTIDENQDDYADLRVYATRRGSTPCPRAGRTTVPSSCRPPSLTGIFSFPYATAGWGFA